MHKKRQKPDTQHHKDNNSIPVLLQQPVLNTVQTINTILYDLNQLHRLLYRSNWSAFIKVQQEQHTTAADIHSPDLKHCKCVSLGEYAQWQSPMLYQLWCKYNQTYLFHHRSKNWTHNCWVMGAKSNFDTWTETRLRTNTVSTMQSTALDVFA